MADQTVITTFEVTPGTCADLLDELREAYAGFISQQEGFVEARLHVNDAQTRIANVSHWRRREDFLAMLRTDEMRERNRRISALCRSFEPVLYEVSAEFG
jgi:heme-degrading monooxygenase HmoA